jgi:hypothetical protein
MLLEAAAAALTRDNSGEGHHRGTLFDKIELVAELVLQSAITIPDSEEMVQTEHG